MSPAPNFSAEGVRMSHDVKFTVPTRSLGKSDIEFIVNLDGERFGTLRISKGTLVWFPRSKKKGRRVSWKRFDAFMDGRKAEDGAALVGTR